MAPRSRTGVLAAGLILIFIGVLFLLNNFYEISVWRLFTRYWPLILILIGLKKLYGYFAWQETSPVTDIPNKE